MPLVRLGLVVIVVGVGLDLFVHAAAGVGAPFGRFTLPEHGAHFVVLLGMLFVLAGVVVGGTKKSHMVQAQKERTDAVR